jgi:hypothetical protein
MKVGVVISPTEYGNSIKNFNFKVLRQNFDTYINCIKMCNK